MHNYVTMGLSFLDYVVLVLELSLVFFWLSEMMAPFNRAWAQLRFLGPFPRFSWKTDKQAKFSKFLGVGVGVRNWL